MPPAPNAGLSGMSVPKRLGSHTSARNVKHGRDPEERNMERKRSRVKLHTDTSAETRYHLNKMAESSGTSIGRIIDRLMVFYREHGGDALADERTRERSLLGRKAR